MDFNFSIYKGRNLADTHAHMLDEKLTLKKEEIANGLYDNGIKFAVEIGTNIKDSFEALDFAEKFQNIYATAGVHPEYANTVDFNELYKLQELIGHNKAVAIGEIGLDYHYGKEDVELQKKLFKAQLEIAKGKKLPIVVHLRDAAEDMLKIVKDMKEYFKEGAVFHCFSQSLEYQRELDRLSDNFYYSFGGAITFKNADKRREVLRGTAKEKILLETDCPYMAPSPYRGEINEPKYVNFIADMINEIFNDNLDEITTANAERFYKINKRG